MGQIEKRGANSYRLGVSCGFDSQNKRIMKYKTIKLTPSMTDKQIEKELAIQLDRFEKEVQAGTYLDGNITLSEFAEKWLKDYGEIHLRPKTLARYKQLLQRVLIALGHKKLSAIQPTNLIEFYKNLAEGGVRLDYRYKLKEGSVLRLPDVHMLANSAKLNVRTVKDIMKGDITTNITANKICDAVKIPLNSLFDIVDENKGLASKTISHHHKLISAMLTTAVQWQLIASNPAERIKPPKVERIEANYYNISEVEQMLALLETEPIKYKVMVHIVLFCGLRLGELSNLEWADINFDENTITISKQAQYLPEHGIYEIKSAKTESGNRTISIPSTLAELLIQYKEWQDEEKRKWGDKWVNSDKLFTQDNGGRMFPTLPSSWFSKFIKRNNLPPLTFHQIRHTHASLLIGQGVDIATVSNRLGHADKSVTLKIYTHALKQNDQKAVETLENLLVKKDN